MQSRVSALLRVTPQVAQHIAWGSRTVARVPGHRSGLEELAVSYYLAGEVLILNNKYQKVSEISDTYPAGDFIDSKDNLYVVSGTVVDEFDKSGSLLDVYFSGLIDPVNVTVDAKQNVYVTDSRNDEIVEYAQGSNVVLYSCNTGFGNVGIAVDSLGDVFVNGGNTIVEYKGGLSACSETTTGISLGSSGGLQIDKKGDLVAGDQVNGIDIIPPPYKSISKTIKVSGGKDYYDDALTQNNDLLFIASPNSAAVWVVKYPAGTLVTTLTSSAGLPFGVATYPYVK